jgi:hypothetical protein
MDGQRLWRAIIELRPTCNPFTLSGQEVYCPVYLLATASVATVCSQIGTDVSKQVAASFYALGLQLSLILRVLTAACRVLKRRGGGDGLWMQRVAYNVRDTRQGVGIERWVKTQSQSKDRRILECCEGLGLGRILCNYLTGGVELFFLFTYPQMQFLFNLVPPPPKLLMYNSSYSL